MNIFVVEKDTFQRKKILNWFNKFNNNLKVSEINSDVTLLKKECLELFFLNIDTKEENNIYEISEEDKDEIINKIKLELKKLSFRESYRGFKYLVECIYEVYILKDFYNVNLSKEIFPKIAKKYNKSIECVHSNIKQAMKIMYYDCDKNTLMEYFKYVEEEKPKLKELIERIIEHIIEK